MVESKNDTSVDQSNTSTTDGKAVTRLSAKQPTLSGSATKAKPSNVVFPKAELEGTVILGEGVVVHPMSKISAEGGDIVIGDYTIIEEFV